MKTHLFQSKFDFRCVSFILGLVCVIAMGNSPRAFAAGLDVGCTANELVNAINSANANAGDDILNLSADCVYTLTAINNSDAALGENGLPVITSSITIHGNHATIERGADAPAFRFFQIDAGGALTLDTVTLRGGNAGAVKDRDGWHGGAIYNRGISNLERVNLYNNQAGDVTPPDYDEIVGAHGGHGGAIFNDASGTLDISTSQFAGNRAGNGGEGMQCGGLGGDGGAIANYGTAFIRDTTLRENLSGSGGRSFSPREGGRGGAIFNAGTFELARSTLFMNRTGKGGDRLTTGSIAGNGGSGGALDNLGTGIILNSTFSQNMTGSPGVLDLTQAHANHAQVPARVGASCGEIALDLTQADPNRDPRYGRSGSGGAIANHATLTLTNLTLHENGVGWALLTRGTGGNLANLSGTLTLQNTIITKSVRGKNCFGELSDSGGNVRYPMTDTTCVGLQARPLLGPLQYNGGATETMALSFASPAVNVGVSAYCPATDQRGIARPQGKRCDSGAYEADPPTLFTLLQPADGEKLERAQVNLKWNPAQRVSWYRVQVRQDSVTGPNVVAAKTIDTKYMTPPLKPRHWYYWRVQACSRVSCVATAWQSFRVAAK